MTCLIYLFINAVAARSGAAVEKHLERMSELYAHFTGWTGTGGERNAIR